jgi:hypothetical protein
MYTSDVQSQSMQTPLGSYVNEEHTYYGKNKTTISRNQIQILLLEPECTPLMRVGASLKVCKTPLGSYVNEEHTYYCKNKTTEETNRASLTKSITYIHNT